MAAEAAPMDGIRTTSSPTARSTRKESEASGQGGAGWSSCFGPTPE